jgi:hypothetical protein
MIRFVGDVHGKHDFYREIVKDCGYSVQLGDFWHDYAPALRGLDPRRHKILGGNHDNYNQLPDIPHYLGDYGTYNLGGIEFYFIRGAYSIDKFYREENVSWWKEEQLTLEQMAECFEDYKKKKPDLVISHECPEELYYDEDFFDTYGGIQVYEPNSTTRFLQKCLNVHRPKTWIFAHHHKDFEKEKDGTLFICLDELSYIDFENEKSKL